MGTFGRRTIAVIMSVIMVLSCFAGMTFSVGADSYGDFYYGELDDGTIEITSYYGKEEEITVPGDIYGKKVTSISGYAFSNNDILKKITLPDSLTNIGNGAFDDCSSIKSMVIPDGVTAVNSSLFCGCISLESVSFSDNVTEIGDYAFQNCGKLKEINLSASLETLGCEAFSGCESLKTVNIPANVTKIDYGCFPFCHSLKEFTIDTKNENYAVVDGVLFNKDITELVAFPGAFAGEYSIPDSVQVIKGMAFYGADELTKIFIPEFVDSVSYGLFSHSKKLEQITVDSNNRYLKSMDGVLFLKNSSTLFSCPNAKQGEYTVPDGIKTIYLYAFSGCSMLTEIKISDDVTEIYGHAFENCEKLKSVTIPNKVEEIKYNTFENCTSLTDVKFGDNIKSIGSAAFKNCTSLPAVTIPDGVGKIEYECFSGCSNLASVKLPSGLTEIELSAFFGCENLKDITIPECVTKIGSRAFLGCSSWKNVVIPDSVTEIGNYSFGYDYKDDDIYDCFKIDDFTIYGSEGSAAQKYAEDYGLNFAVYTGCIHTNKEIRNEKAATCTENGYTGDVYCNDCGALVKKGEQTDKAEHKFENGKCSVCGAADENSKSEEKTTKPSTEKTTKPSTEKTTEPKTENPTEPSNKPTEKTAETTTEAANESLGFAGNSGVKGKIDLPSRTVLIYPESAAGISVDEFKALFDGAVEVNFAGKSLAFSGMTFKFAGEEYTFILKGDIDGNGKITAADARIALRHAARLESINSSILSAAEVDEDGRISASDARIILRFAAKLIGQMDGESKYAENAGVTETEEPTVKKNFETTAKSETDVTKPTEKTTEPTTKMAEPTTEPTTEKEDPAAENGKTNKALSPESAVDIYLSQKDVWMAYPEFYPMNGYRYGFLDLDFDGTLELIRNINDGSGRYSSNAYFKINMTDYSVYELKYISEEAHEGYDYSFSDDYPKLLKDKADGSLIYCCYDFMRVMTGDYATYYGTLNMTADGCIDSKLLFGEHHQEAGLYKNPNSVDEYFIYKDNTQTEVSKSQYDEEIASYFDAMEDVELTWSLIPGKDLETAVYSKQKELLLDSYNQFGYKNFSFENYDLIKP